MSDNPKQPPESPPPLPLHLVRPRTPRENALQRELEKARADLEAERALTEVLRNQPTTAQMRATEETLPGLGAISRAPRTPGSRAPNLGRRRRRAKVTIVAALIGLAASLAGLRYPGLMGPIEQFAKSLTEAFQ